jgi:crotonobetainyl-CoA:carnitine CoA-transferase CaiB-like acyl-CoA transferase
MERLGLDAASIKREFPRPVRIDGSRKVDGRAPPTLGQHTAEILATLKSGRNKTTP